MHESLPKIFLLVFYANIKKYKHKFCDMLFKDEKSFDMVRMFKSLCPANVNNGVANPILRRCV